MLEKRNEYNYADGGIEKELTKGSEFINIYGC